MAIAQDKVDYNFTKLTTREGLSSNYVNCITQDSSGFIWIGTSDGLNRYDGRSIKTFRHQANNPDAIPGNQIIHIVVDKNGILWIGIREVGLCRYDHATGKFILYKHNDGDEYSLSSNEYAYPFIDSKQQLYVATNNGINRYNPSKNNFDRIEIPLAIRNRKVVFAQQVFWIKEDNQQQLWCSIGYTLYLYNPVNNSFREYSTAAYAILNDILPVNRQEWLVTFWGSGLHKFYPSTGQFVKMNIPEAANEAISLARWKDMDGKEYILISNDENHTLVFYSPENGQYKFTLHDPDNPASLSENGLSTIFVDHNNIAWIATNGSGVNILDPRSQFFKNILLLKNQSGYRPYNQLVNSIFSDEENYWIGAWFKGGLYRYDKHWKLLQQYKRIPPASTSSLSQTIGSFYRDTNNDFWFSTDSGLVYFNPRNNNYKTYIPSDTTDPVYQAEQLHRIFRNVLPLNDHQFWVRNKRWGLYQFDKQQQRFIKHYMNDVSDSHSLPNNNLNAMVYDKWHRLWVSTDNGLARYDPATDRFIVYKNDPVNKNSLAHNETGDIVADSEGNLWIGTKNGVSCFNLADSTFKNYSVPEGLCNENVYRLCFDKQEKLWITTQNGVSCFDIKKKVFYSFSVTDGLPADNMGGILYLENDSTMLLGGYGILVRFDPRKIPVNTTPPRTVIHSIKVMDEPYYYRVNKNGEKEIYLSWQQNVINAQFSVINYSNARQNAFYYKLEGFDKNWRQSEEGNISYTNLDPGTYTLHVKGSNNYGVMSTKDDLIIVHIASPFWKTAWFRILSAAGIIFLAFFLFKKRTAYIRKEERVKTTLNKRIYEAETTALRTQMNPHFIFNTLNSINRYVIRNDAHTASDYLTKFARLIRLILDNSKNEFIPLSKELEALRLYLLMESIRFDEKFDHEIIVRENIDPATIKIQPMILQPFVENAIWHGLLHKAEKGKVLIEIKQPEAGMLEISITDNGIGREKAGELKSKDSGQYKSQGLQITSGRIRMNNERNVVEIFDLKDEQAMATGTRVVLTISVN